MCAKNYNRPFSSLGGFASLFTLFHVTLSPHQRPCWTCWCRHLPSPPRAAPPPASSASPPRPCSPAGRTSTCAAVHRPLKSTWELQWKHDCYLHFRRIAQKTTSFSISRAFASKKVVTNGRRRRAQWISSMTINGLLCTFRDKLVTAKDKRLEDGSGRVGGSSEPMSGGWGAENWSLKEVFGV